MSWRKVAATNLLIALAHQIAGLRVLEPRLDRVPLDPGKRRLDGPVMGVDDAPVAADQRGERDGLGGREGDVAPGTVDELAVPVPAPEFAPGAVRHLAFEHGPEDVRIDRTFEAELARAPAEPGARLPVLRIVLHVVAVLLVVGDALRGRGDGADRGDHVSTASDRLSGPAPAPVP